jgi:hypothetical protein
MPRNQVSPCPVLNLRTDRISCSKCLQALGWAQGEHPTDEGQARSEKFYRRAVSLLRLIGVVARNGRVFGARRRRRLDHYVRVKENLVLVSSTHTPHLGPLPRVRGEGDDWEGDWEPRVPLGAAPWARSISPLTGLGQDTPLLWLLATGAGH